MTISANSAKSGPVAGDNSNATFTYAFPVLNAGDLIVIRTNEKGEETRLFHPADFTATGIGEAAGGTVTLTTTPVVGENITILRDMEAEQSTDFVFQAGYLPQEQEDALDRLTMVQQSQAEQLSRALTLGTATNDDPATFRYTLNRLIAAEYAVSTITPSLTLDPVLDVYLKESSPVELDSLLTHSRTGTATFTDRKGIIQSAKANELRTGHHVFKDSAFQRAGIRVDPAATNLLRDSENFSNWGQEKTITTADQSDGPGGSASMDKLAVDATTITHGGTAQIISAPTSITAGQWYVHSVFVKPADGPTNGIKSVTLSTDGLGQTTFDIENLNVSAKPAGAEARIDSYGLGLYRLWWAIEAASSDPVGRAHIKLSNQTSAATFLVPPGVQPDAHIFIWGHQLELGDTPTSYIKTDTTTATRAADIMSIATANLPTSTDEVTLIFEGFIDRVDSAAGNTIESTLAFWATSSGNRLWMYLVSNGGSRDGEPAIRMQNASGAYNAYGPDIAQNDTGIPFKIAFSVNTSTTQIFLNGTAGSLLTHNTGIPDFTSADITQFLEDFVGSLSKLRIFDVSLGESALVKETTL